MDTGNRPFDQLLEKYVFSVAEAFIDKVDMPTQRTIIDLISQLDAEPMLFDDLQKLL